MSMSVRNHEGAVQLVCYQYMAIPLSERKQQRILFLCACIDFRSLLLNHGVEVWSVVTLVKAITLINLLRNTSIFQLPLLKEFFVHSQPYLVIASP